MWSDSPDCDTDDDPLCDFGAAAGDQTCTLRVKLCLNVNDPRLVSSGTGLPACTPIDVARVQLVRPKQSSPADATDTANRDALEAALAGIGGVVRGECTNSGPKHGQLCQASSDCDSTPGSGNGVCKGRFVAFDPPLATANNCTAFAEIKVPRARTKTLRLKASPSNDPVTGRRRPADRDSLRLRCNPPA